jgi:uncharacterized protein
MAPTAAIDLQLASWSFAAAVGAALLAGGLRGFSGFGSALVLSPSLAAIYGPAAGVPVALLLELTLSVPFVPPALPRIDRGRVALLCAAAGLTVPAGAWLLLAIDERALRFLICAVALAAVAILAFGWRYGGRPHAAATAGTGALSGVLAGSTGMSGPPVLFLYLSGRDPVETVRASFIVYFSVIGAISLAALAVGGALGEREVALAAALVVPYLAAALAGARLFRRAGEASYRRLALFVLVAVAVVSLPL